MSEVQDEKKDLYAKLDVQEDFEFLLIKHKDISKIRFDDPDFPSLVYNLDIYETVKTSSNDFLENVALHLKIDKIKNPRALHTQTIWNNGKYIYELIHIVLTPGDLPVEYWNGLGNVIKTDSDLIFGNVIMLKTELLDESDNVKIVNCNKNDLYELLENRVRHKGVKVDDDGEIEEFSWYHDPKKFIKEFMVNDEHFKEVGFLKHNLQIYYTKGNKDDLEKLIDDKYDQLIVLTKITDEHYGNITLEELKTIFKLLKTECPLICPDEWLKSNELDESKKFIFNKYRALKRAEKEYL